jgi:flagellar biosynthesis chaperone FliJ
MIALTPEQEKHAVELFAQGNKRSEVVAILLDTDTDIIKQFAASADEAQFRKQLSDKLQSCDPNSTRFAMTKHQAYYEAHRAALQKAISNHYENMVIKSVNGLENQIAVYDERIEELKHHLSHSVQAVPVGASEYIRMQKLLVTIEKRRVELQDKYLESLKRIHQKTIAF